jgi:hypothetical protein
MLIAARPRLIAVAEVNSADYGREEKVFFYQASQFPISTPIDPLVHQFLLISNTEGVKLQ